MLIDGMGHDLPRGVWPQIIDAIADNARRRGEPREAPTGAPPSVGARSEQREQQHDHGEDEQDRAGGGRGGWLRQEPGWPGRGSGGPRAGCRPSRRRRWPCAEVYPSARCPRVDAVTQIVQQFTNHARPGPHPRAALRRLLRHDRDRAGARARTRRPRRSAPRGWRSAAVLLVLVAALAARRAPRGAGRAARCVAGAAGVAGYQLTFFAAVDATGVAVGTVVALGSGPVFAGLLGRAVARRGADPPLGRGHGARRRRRRRARRRRRRGRRGPGGIALALGAGLSYATYTVAAKVELTAGHAPEAVMARCFGLGGLAAAARARALAPRRPRRPPAALAAGRLPGRRPDRARLRAVRPRPAPPARGRGRDADPGRAADGDRARRARARRAARRGRADRRRARAGRPRACWRRPAAHRPAPASCSRRERPGPRSPAPPPSTRSPAPCARASSTATWPPDAPLREQHLAQAYGVARHTVRAALRALAAEGLVRVEPHRGARVTALDAEDLEGLGALRIALEVEAARRALARHDGRLPAPVHAAQAALEAACLRTTRTVRPASRRWPRPTRRSTTPSSSPRQSPRIVAAHRALGGELRLFLVQLRPAWDVPAHRRRARRPGAGARGRRAGRPAAAHRGLHAGARGPPGLTAARLRRRRVRARGRRCSTASRWSGSTCGEAELRVRHGGDGPAALLLHGHPRTHTTWHRVAPRLAARFTVVCPDLRGYGASSKPPTTADHEPYSKRAMAARRASR